MDSDNPLPQPSDHFPTGLRVLVVDEDPTHSKTLATFNYKGTICNTMQAAVDLLREGEGGNGFDIVITDFNSSKVEGFTHLVHVLQEMKIPLIMMSVDGDTSRVMQSVNICQQVTPKRMLEGVQVSSADDKVSCGKKRKDDREGESCSHTPSSSSSAKKQRRVVWHQELHQKFVKAVEQIGVDKAGPKKILDLMDNSSLSRENVASHLQKHRQNVKRKQSENKVKAAVSNRVSSADHASGNLHLQTSVAVQHNVVRNEMTPMSSHANASAHLPITNASRISFSGQLDSESRNKNKPHNFQQVHHFNHLAGPSTHMAPLSRGYDGVGRGAIVSGVGRGAMLNQNDQANLGSFGCSNIDVFDLYDPVNFNCGDLDDHLLEFLQMD